jgi:hypothetical protein
MRRIEPAFPDLLPVTHVMRPGYLPRPQVTLDPIRMSVVWSDAPRRTLPNRASVPRHPVRAIGFASVAKDRGEVLERLLERGSSVLLVVDDPLLDPADLGLDSLAGNTSLTTLIPVLPSPLVEKMVLPEAWLRGTWAAMIGLFPFPGADVELERRIDRLHHAGAAFVATAPLLLTPKDRHRILDSNEGNGNEDGLEDCLFHADVSRGLQALERQAGISLHQVGIEPVLSCMVPRGGNSQALRTALLLRLWARRLDQCHEEGSHGWRLRRAATALEPLQHNPKVLAEEGNLRVIPGFDPWVESFTRALWHGGEPVDQAWRCWTRSNSQKSDKDLADEQ